MAEVSVVGEDEGQDLVSGIPIGHLQTCWLAGKACRTWHLVIFMAMIYYSEGYKKKIS